MIKNYGLNWEKELQEQSEKDWVFAATSPVCMAEILLQERRPCLPKGEVQKGKEDMSDCATRSPINLLETKFNWLIKNNKLSKESVEFVKQFMNDKGQVEISDAFTAIKSGTTPMGNSLKAPLEAIRLFGICPKKLMPLEKWMTWEDFHNPKRITTQVEEVAKKSLQFFSFNYEKVYLKDLEVVLSRDMIGLCGSAWPDPVNGEYPRVEESFNHAFMGFDLPKTYIFDNYYDTVDWDFIKKLASNYKLGDYGYRVIIKEKLTPQQVQEKKLSIIEEIIKKMIEVANLISKELQYIKGRFKDYIGEIFK